MTVSDLLGCASFVARTFLVSHGKISFNDFSFPFFSFFFLCLRPGKGGTGEGEGLNYGRETRRCVVFTALEEWMRRGHCAF